MHFSVLEKWKWTSSPSYFSASDTRKRTALFRSIQDSPFCHAYKRKYEVDFGEMVE